MNHGPREGIALALVFAALAGVPVLLFGYNAVAQRRQAPADTQLVHITGVRQGPHNPGTWTLGPVAGRNYWLHRAQPLQELKIAQGAKVALRIGSADVHHGFGIPALFPEHYDIAPGEWVTVPVDTTRAGSFPALCTMKCSPYHDQMWFVLTVEAPLGLPDIVVKVTVSETEGFQPDRVTVHQGQIVQLEVSSTTDGTGAGIGFAVTGYETTVDLQGIRKGQTRTFKFRADLPGEFIIYSSTAAGAAIDSAIGAFVVTPKP